MLRQLLILLVVISATAAVYRTCVLSYLCNLEQRQIQTSTEALFGQLSDRGAKPQAAEQLALLSKRIEQFPHDIDLYAIAAANQRILERPAEAANTYKAALRYARRPELYFNLGIVLYEQGRTAEAYENFREAALFDPETLSWGIPDSGMLDRLTREIQQYETRIRARLPVGAQ